MFSAFYLGVLAFSYAFMASTLHYSGYSASAIFTFVVATYILPMLAVKTLLPSVAQYLHKKDAIFELQIKQPDITILTYTPVLNYILGVSLLLLSATSKPSSKPSFTIQEPN